MRTGKRLVFRCRGGTERREALFPNRHGDMQIPVWPTRSRRTGRIPGEDSRAFANVSRQKTSDKFPLRSEVSARILPRLCVRNENDKRRSTDLKYHKNRPLTEDPKTAKEFWTDPPRQPSNKAWFARTIRTVSESVPRPNRIFRPGMSLPGRREIHPSASSRAEVS